MGRHRKDGNPLGLELRAYWHHGQVWYRHRNGDPEALGSDIKKANERARVYNDPDKRYGTLPYFIDLYLADARAGRLHKNKSPRTVKDNEEEAKYLKAAFASNLPQDLVEQPNLISDYRDNRSIKAPVRANREMSLLSSVYSWLIEKGHCPGLNMNPVKLIARNSETAKDTYVEDPDVNAVRSIAVRSVVMAMELIYRTLARPSTVLQFQSTDLRTKTIGGVATRVLTLPSTKGGRTVDVEVTPEIDAALALLRKPDMPAGVELLRYPLIYGRGYKAYTERGMAHMLYRYCEKCKIVPFGLMDMRAKGATDMYLNGEPLEKIQMLMGHKSVTTTEIYIKRHLATISIAQPNRVKITAEVVN